MKSAPSMSASLKSLLDKGTICESPGLSQPQRTVEKPHNLLGGYLVNTARSRFAFFRLASFSTARSMRTSARLAFSKLACRDAHNSWERAN